MAQLLYPIGIQSFSSIHEGGYTYVDKTDYIWELASTGKFYFLSRPRRFGKSLLLSTIEEFFKGRRELFEGLAISREDYGWAEHAVLHLDFTGNNYSVPSSVESVLNENLRNWESDYEVQTPEHTVEERFRNVIKAAHEKTGRQVVILIDEYDKPLLETVDQPELQEKYRNILRGFYGNLKKMDSDIRFAMLTGVTKFGHLSIFSDLNNLQDISMEEAYSGICGITAEEMHQYFDASVRALAERTKLTVPETYEKLRLNYDGYHFSPQGGAGIYNPYSLINTLKIKDFGDYWFRTDTPTFLIKLIKTRQISIRRLSEVQIARRAVENVSLDMKSSLVPILYQAGYLTIKGYRPEVGTIRLGFPNREVEQGFLIDLMNAYMPANGDDSEFFIVEFYDDVCAGNAEGFMQRLQSFFSDFSYDGFDRINLEQHYQDITYIIFKLLGFLTHIEYKTASGRIDMVVKTPENIFVFEFKVDGTAEAALRQIDEKGYLLPFKADGRRLVKIGANFSCKTRSLDSWLIEEA